MFGKNYNKHHIIMTPFVDESSFVRWITPPGSLGDFNIGSAVDLTLMAMSSDGSIVSYAVISGTLPTGITLDSSTGTLAGTAPGNIQVSSFVVRSTNTFGNFSDIMLSMNIVNDAPVWQTPSGLIGAATAGGNSFSTSVFATDPKSLPLSYSLTAGSLPSGLTLSSTGTISGIMPYLSETTLYTFALSVSDGTFSVPRSFSISVNFADTIVWQYPSSGSLGTDVQGKYFYAEFFAISYTSNTQVTYSLTSGTLPNGLTLDGANGVISGNLPTVTTDTIDAFQITATDGAIFVPAQFTITTIVDNTGVDSFANSVVMLMHMDEIDNTNSANQYHFVDVLGHTVTVNNTDPSNNRDIHLFGNAAASFSGTGNIVVAGGSEFDLSSTDFTIEFYALPASSNMTSVPCPFVTVGGEMVLFWDGSANLALNYVNSSNASVTATFPWAMIYGDWYHIALVRSGATLTAFVNGNVLASVSIGGGIATPSLMQVELGSCVTVPSYYNGLLDEVRITSAARYSTHFTLATRPFPNIPVWTGTNILVNAVENSPYTATVTAIQADSHNLSFTALSGMPAGLSVNVNTGVISGTPPAAASDTVYNPILIVSDAYNAIEKTFSLTDEHHVAPVWNTPAGSLGTFVENTPVSVTLSATSAQFLPLTFSVLTGQLPTGLMIDGSAITGTAPAESANAVFSFTLSVSDGVSTAARDFSIVIDQNQPPVWVSNGTIAVGVQSTAVDATLVATDPLGQSLIYSLESGTLPAGVVLSGNQLIGSFPVVSNDTTYSFTIRATNAGGLYADQSLSLVSESGTDPTFITVAGSIGAYQAANSSVNVTLAGNSNIANVVPFFSIVSGSLPAGLTLENVGGSALITGTPAPVPNTTTYDFSVEITNYVHNVVQNFSVTVDVNHGVSWGNTPSTLGTFNSGSNVSLSLAAISFDGTGLTYTISAGSLPAGLTMNVVANSASITGTPSPIAVANSPQTYNFTVNATNGIDPTKDFSIVIVSEPVTWVSPTISDLGTLYLTVAQNLAFVAASNTAISLTYSVTAGTLPSGLSLNATTGVVTGTPTTSGNYAFTLTASDGINTVSNSFTSVVAPVGTPNWVTESNGVTPATAAVGYNFQLVATDPNNDSLTFTAGSLPAGLTLSASGVLSGTPAPVANTTTTNVDITVSNGNESATRTFAIIVNYNGALTWTTPAGVILSNVATTTVDFQLQVFNATPNALTFSIASGSFPNTLSLNTSTGEITGNMPSATTNTTYSFSVNVTNGLTSIARSFQITDFAITPVWVTGGGSIGTSYGDQYFSANIAATSPLGLNDITFMVVSGSLPAGLTLTNNGNNTANISGYMATVPTNTTSNFTISASNPTVTVNRSFSITALYSPYCFVYPTGSLGSVISGNAYMSTGLKTTQITSTFSVTNGTLPTGITLDSSTGTLAGTAPVVSVPASSNFEITAVPQNSSYPTIAKVFGITTIPTSSEPYTDSYSDSVVLEMHLCGNGVSTANSSVYWDQFGHNISFTSFSSVSTPLSYDRAKFGGASAFFNSSAMIIPDAPEFNFSATDFTIDFWAAFQPAPINGQTYTFFGNKYFNISYTTGNLTFSCTPSSSTLTSFNFPYTIVDRSWYNIAFVMASGVMTVWVNGVALNSISVGSLSVISGAPTNLFIGAQSVSGFIYNNPFNGFMNDFRITTAARFSGSTYAVPTVPVVNYPVITTSSLSFAYQQQTTNFAYGGVSLPTEFLTSTNPYTMGLTFSLDSGTLVPGLSLSSSGVISGTPANPVSNTNYNFAVAVSDGYNTTHNNFSTIVVNYNPPIWILPSGSIGTIRSGYSFSAVANAVSTIGTSLTYSKVSGTLPTGMTLNTNTGLITGTPPVANTAATYSFVLGANDGVFTSTNNYSITVLSNLAPVWNLSAGSLGSFLGGTVISNSVTATDPQSETLTYAIVSGTLPAGLSLNTSNGLISGTMPVIPGANNVTSAFTISATNGYATSTIALSLTDIAIPVPVFGTNNMDVVPYNVYFSEQINATDPSGYPLTYTYSGTLPSNVTLTSSGVISGVPGLPPYYDNYAASPQQLTYTFTVTASNGLTSASMPIQVQVYVPQPPVFAITPLAGLLGTYITGSVFPTTNITATNAFNLPINYSISGTLPSGLTIANTTGAISGTFAPLSSNTAFTFSVVASNGYYSVSKAFSILEETYPVPTWNTSAGLLGNTNASVVFTYDLSATSYSDQPITYSLVSGSLPGGLTLSNSGVITGTVTSYSSTFTQAFTVGASDSYNTVNRNFSITVEQIVAPIWTAYMSNHVVYNEIAPFGTISSSPWAATYHSTQVLSNTLSVASYVYDPLGIPITFSTTSTLPSGITLNSAGYLTGTLGNNFSNGSFPVAIVASNGFYTSESPTVYWNFYVVQVAPPIWFVGGTSVLYSASHPGIIRGGETGTYFLSAGDPQQLPLSYSLASGTLPIGMTLGNYGGTNNYEIISGTAANPGSNTVYTFAMTATNNVVSSTQSITFEVLANTPPVWNTASNLGTYMTSNTVNITLSATSSSGDALTYGLVSGTLPPGLTVNSSGSISGTITAIDKDATTYNFVLEVAETDGVNSPVTKAFSITVSAYPQAYFITSTGSLGNAIGGTVYSTTLAAADPNAGLYPIFSISSGTLPAGLSLTYTGGSEQAGLAYISGTATNPSSNTTSTFVVEIKDNDNYAEPTYGTFSITVIKNAPPVFADGSSYANSTIGFASFDHIFTATDPHGQNVTYAIGSGTIPAGATFNTSNGELSGVLSNPSATHTYTFGVVASNGVITATLPATIIVNKYLAPVWSGNSTLGTYVNGSTIDYTSATATDPQGGSITYAIVGPSFFPGLTLNSVSDAITGTFSIVSNTTSYTYYISASNANLSTNELFSMTVKPYAAPVWSTPSGSLGLTYGGSTFSQNLVANDPNGTGLMVAYSLTSGTLPAGLTLTSGGLISGIVTNPNSNTTLSFAVTASNGYASANRSFSITVDITSAPVWTTSANLGTLYGTATVSIPLVASDPQGLTITYSADPINAANGYTLPAGLLFNAANSTIYGTLANPTTTGTFNFAVDVTNGIASNARTFYASIAHVNPPIWQIANGTLLGNAIGLATCSNTAVMGAVSNLLATDTLGLPVTYTLSGTLPMGIILNSTTGVFSGTFVNVSSTTNYPFTIIASNGYLTNTETFSITVEPETAPIFSTVGSLGSVLGGYNFSNTVVATDAIYSTITYSNVTALPANLTINAVTGVISGIAVNPSSANTMSTFTVSASDGYLSNTANVSVTVLYNQPPIFTNLFSGQVVGTWTTGISNSVTITAIDVNSQSISFSGSMPSGLTISNTGVISGTITTNPATPIANLTATITATNGISSNTVSFFINELQAPAPVWNSPAPGSLGNAIENYSITPVTFSAIDPNGFTVTYAVANGTTLPTGLTLHSNGVLTGVVSETLSAGTYSFGIVPQNVYGSAANAQTYSYNVIYNAPPVYTSSTLPSGFSTEVYPGGSIVFTDPSGLNQTISYSLASGNLPNGLTLYSNGILAGTLGTVTTTTNYNFAVIASSLGGVTLSNTLSIVVSPYISPSWTTAPGSLGSVLGGNSITFTVGAIDHEGLGLTYALANGTTLPAGLTLTTSGVISGTATNPISQTTTTNFDIAASDAYGSNTESFAITVVYNGPPVFANQGLLTTVYGGNAITQNQWAASFTSSSYVSFALPSGYDLDSTAGYGLEFQVYFTDAAALASGVFLMNAFRINRWNLIVSSTGLTIWNQSLNGSYAYGAYTYSGSYSFTTNTWYHIFITGQGAHTYMFVNGVNIGTFGKGGNSTGNGDTTTNGIWTNGSSFGSTLGAISCNIFGFRIVTVNPQWYSNGVVLYLPYSLSGFTPPTPLTPLPSTEGQVLLMFNGNDDFTDQSGANSTITISGSPNIMLEQLVNSVSSVIAVDAAGRSITYALANGTSLPTNGSLNATTGVISGITTNPSSNTTTSFVVSGYDGVFTGYGSYSIVVLDTLAPVFSTAAGSLGTYASNAAVSTSISATDPQSFPFTYSFVSGNLPNGVTFYANGLITGNTGYLTTTTTSTFAVSATNGTSSGTRTFSITVNAVPAPTFSTAAGSLGTVLGGYYFSNTVVATQAGYSITYALSSGTLPAGLNLNTANGLINGTTINPASTQTATTFAISAFNGYSNATQTFSIQVVYDQAPIINTAAGSLANVFGGSVVTKQIVAYDPTGYNQTLTYSLASGTLPTGLSMSNTGLISGTTATVSSNTVSNFAVMVANPITNATHNYSISVDAVVPPTWISNANLGYYAPFETVNQTLVAADNNGLGLTYVISSGSLPLGLAMSNTGVITGTVSSSAAVGLDTFTVKASDSLSNASQAFMMNVVSYQPPVWTTTGTLVSGVGNTTVNVVAVATSLENYPITYSLVSGTLPGTLTLVANSGVIAGTLPNIVGTYTFTLGAYDGHQTTNQALSVYVPTAPPIWTSFSLPSASNGGPYSTTLTAVNNSPTFSIVSGSLAPGLTLNSTTGVISGTPSGGTNTYTVTIAATNSSGSVNQTFYLTVLGASNYDPYSQNVILLMPMTNGTVGSNSASIYADVMGHTFSVATGTAPTLQIQPTYNGLGLTPAAYFTASSVIGAPVGTEFIFGNNDWTIEWSSLGSQINDPIILGSTLNATGASIFYIQTTSVYMATYGVTSAQLVLSSTASSLTNAWLNYAVVKHGSTVTLYVNGEVVATTTGASTASMATPLYVTIGALTANALSLKNIRITNGSARYNGAYTVPSSFPTPPSFNTPVNTLLGTFTTGVNISNITISANDPWGLGLTYFADGLPNGLSINSTTGVISGTPTGYTIDTTQIPVTVTVKDYYGNIQVRDFLISVLAAPVADTQGGSTVLLMHFDGQNGSNTFNDVMGHTVTIANGTPTLSTAWTTNNEQNGGSALSLSGNSTIQVTPIDNEFNFGNNDFTIEMDFAVTGSSFGAVASPNVLVSMMNSTAYLGYNWYFGITSNSAFQMVYSANGSSTLSTLTFSGATMSLDTWYKVALVRKTGNATVYLNGLQFGTTQALPPLVYSPQTMCIGGIIGNSVSYLTGNIDELRITNGYARYTQPYTPVTVSFANPINWTAGATSAVLSGVTNAPVTYNLTPTEPYGASFSTLNVNLPVALTSSLTVSNGVVTGTLPTVSTDTNYQITATAISAYSAAAKTFVLTNYATPAAVDPYANYVTCFMSFNGIAGSNATNMLYNPAFLDQTGLSTVQPVGNPSISTTVINNSGGSLALNGSSALVLYANSASTFSFGANDFTIECSIYFNSVANAQFVQSAASNSLQSWSLGYSASNLVFQYSINGTSATVVDFAWTPSTNTWYQLALVRSGSNVYAFVNGTQIGSTYTTGLGTLFTVSTAQIGFAQAGPSAYLNGNIDAVRITNGFGRYTANYTPAEFPVPVEWTTPAGTLTNIIGGNLV